MVDSEISGRIEIKVAHIEQMVYAIRDNIQDIKDDIRERLATAEKVHDDMEKRIRTLESARNRIYGAAAGIGAVAGSLMSFLFWLFSK